MPGRLVLAATPIGDPRDASTRLVLELTQADVVAAEDTRRLRRLLRELGVVPQGRLYAYHDHNEGPRTDELLDELLAGSHVLVVTDAGMPTVSDPGFRIVAAAIDAGIEVSVVPGPSAVLAALAVSGLPVDRFCFEGFLPRHKGKRVARLRELAEERRTMVFFEAPHRIAAALTDMTGAFGAERRAAVCRELTKTYEEVRRGPLSELEEWAEGGVRGEITVVVEGAPAPAAADLSAADLAALVASAVSGGTDRKAAIAEVALRTGRRKREVYDAVVAGKRPTSSP